MSILQHSSYSATSQMQVAAADEALRARYFDPRTAKVGDRRVPYREEDAADDRAWHDAEALLAKRDLCLVDDGNGYVVGWLYAADGSRLERPVTEGPQPATAREE